MSDLNTQLEGLWLKFEGDRFHDRQEFIAEAKQTFIDAGWISVKGVEDTGTYKTIMADIESNPRLTGQQWYDKSVAQFTKDLQDRGIMPGSSDYNNLVAQFIKSVRKACDFYDTKVPV